MAVMSNDTFWKTFNSKPKTTSGLAGNVQQGQPQTATGSVSGSWSNPARTVTTTDPAGNSTSKQVTSGGYATPPGVNQFPDTPVSNLGKVDADLTYDDIAENGQTFDATNYQNFLNNKEQLSTTQQPDITSYINQLADAQKKSRIAALDKAKTNSLANLDTEQASIEPTYYNKRNQAQANADIGAMNFAQYMAARGIKGNAGAMPEIYRNAGLQSQIGSLDQQEAQDFSNIARQRTNINNGYESDVTNANASVDSQALQNYIDQWNKNRDYNLNLGQLTGNINGTPTLAGKQFDYNINKDTQDRKDTYANNLGLAINPTADVVVPADIQDRINNAVNGQYGGDYSEYIQAHPEDAYYGTALRNTKMYGDLDKYGQYVPKTLSGINAGLQNKKAELDNAATEIQNSYLPDTLKLQAKRLQQQVDTGSLDYDTALAQLKKMQLDNEWTPKINQANINQSNAQTASAMALANNRASGGSSSGTTKTEQKNNNFSQAYDYYKNSDVQTAINNMLTDKKQLIKDFGPSGYKSLWDTVLADAIRAGQAKNYSNYFKEPEY